MSQKITTNIAHQEIAKDIRLAKQRMFREHSKGAPLGDALQGFLTEVKKSVAEQEALLNENPPGETERRLSALGLDSSAAEMTALRDRVAELEAKDPTKSETTEADEGKVFVSETDFNEIGDQLVNKFEYDEEDMAPAIVLLNYLWLALHSRLFSDTPLPIQIDPNDVVEKVMRRLIAQTIHGEQLEQFGNYALKAFRKESRRLAPRSKGGDA